MIDLSEEEYALLLKIASGMRNRDHFTEEAAVFRRPVYDLWDYDDGKPWNSYDRHINDDGKAAMREYERKHNVFAESE